MVNDNLGMVEMLAATLAHEVKNPLSLLRANIDYIELCDVEKKYTKSYNVMKSQLEKTDSILNNFVRLLQSSGEKTTQVDLCRVISKVVEDYSEGHCLEILTDIKAETLQVLGNQNLLAIVFSNIIKNAIEAGAKKIIISAVKTDGKIHFKITDDGHGISQGTLERLSENYSYTTKKYGNGLGVLICRQTILGCGGSYEIGNSPGGGCEVNIELPAV